MWRVTNMKMLTSLLVAALLIIGASSAAEAGRLYDQYGPNGPRVIQSDDTMASAWDEDLGGWKQVLVSCIQGEDPCGLTNTSLMRVSGGRVRLFNVMTDVTTNTTSATTTIHSGGKTPIATVSGTGAVTATVTLYGDHDNTTTDGTSVCVITLSGTTRHTKGCDSGDQFTKDYAYYHAVTTNVTGTGATVTFDVAVGAAGSGSSAGGGAGDASAANQTTMINHLNTLDNIVSGVGINVSQINGVTPLMGAGATGTGSHRVTEANDSQLSAGIGATGDAAIAAGATGSLNAKIRLLTGLANDPCAVSVKTHITINISTATTTELTPSLAGASTKWYVCALNIVTAAANNVALVDDDTDGCGSPTAGLAGGVTAASGWNFAANGGIVAGNGGNTVFKSVTSNSVLCLMTSAATQLSGSIQVVAAP